MKVDLVPLPSLLNPESLAGRTVVVFDVLRATTTLTAALAAGVRRVFVFPDVTTTLAVAAAATEGPRMTCGEVACLKPAGFDLGNSPGGFVSELHRGADVYMATTNGTRALLAARGANHVLVGALVNARAAAAQVRLLGRDCILLCAGTGGYMATEDLLGAGAVLSSLQETGPLGLANDGVAIALDLFRIHRADLPRVLRQTTGGRNVTAAGLEADIDFCACLNRFQNVGRLAGTGHWVEPMDQN